MEKLEAAKRVAKGNALLNSKSGRTFKSEEQNPVQVPVSWHEKRKVKIERSTKYQVSDSG
jgi:hypothetical protein